MEANEEVSLRIIIETDKWLLMLRQLVSADAEHYFKLLDANRAHLSQHGDVTAQKYPDLESVRKSIDNPEDPKRLRFGIWESFVFVGTVRLTPLGKGVCETGGWTGAEFCRRGYGVLTRRALAEYALNKLKFRRVIARTHPENMASQGMLAKAGFKRFRRTKENHYFAFDPRTVN